LRKFLWGSIFDHGDYQTSNPQGAQRFASYAALRENIGHTVLKVTDGVPIKGVDVQVVSAGASRRQVTPPAANVSRNSAPNLASRSCNK
jgi:hypothetical protein